MQTHPLRRFLSTLAVLFLAAAAGCSKAPDQPEAPREKIVVSGASGQLGELVVKELLARGVPAADLILVSRSPEQLEQYAQLGASTRYGDFSKPESLPEAFAGGSRMLLISIGFGGVPRPEAHKHAIDAATAAGIEHIAYTSYVAVSHGDTTGLAEDHVQTEAILKESGVAWTMLRNSIYSNLQAPLAAKMLADGKAVVPADEHPIGYVTREDCAAAAAAVLTTPGHENKAYDITGPELIGVREIAAAASAVTGRPIEVSMAEPGAPREQRPFGGPALSVTSTHVEELTGRPPTSLEQFFETHKDQLLAAG